MLKSIIILIKTIIFKRLLFNNVIKRKEINKEKKGFMSVYMKYDHLSKDELINLLIQEQLNAKNKYDTNKRAREDQQYRLFNSCKGNAKKHGKEFNLEMEDIVIPTHCPIFGWELTNISGEGRVKTNASIDRIDSKKGYIKGNIIVMCDLANRMKQNATKEDLILFAKGVLNFYATK